LQGGVSGEDPRTSTVVNRVWAITADTDGTATPEVGMRNVRMAGTRHPATLLIRPLVHTSST
jgi:hypothetical protein